MLLQLERCLPFAWILSDGASYAQDGVVLCDLVCLHCPVGSEESLESKIFYICLTSCIIYNCIVGRILGLDLLQLVHQVGGVL